MKFLKIFLISFIILVIIIVAGGFFLPKHYSVSRSVIINAPDSVIYRNIGDFKEFYKWSPWAKMDTKIQTNFTGTPLQKDHTYTWKGDKTGAGEMKIMEAIPYKLINLDLFFKEPFESHADTKFTIEPKGTEQEVTWTMSGENNLIGKWMYVFISMDKMIGKDFEKGLSNLKKKSETPE